MSSPPSAVRRSSVKSEPVGFPRYSAPPIIVRPSARSSAAFRARRVGRTLPASPKLGSGLPSASRRPTIPPQLPWVPPVQSEPGKGDGAGRAEEHPRGRLAIAEVKFRHPAVAETRDRVAVGLELDRRQVTEAAEGALQPPGADGDRAVGGDRHGVGAVEQGTGVDHGESVARERGVRLAAGLQTGDRHREATRAVAAGADDHDSAVGLHRERTGAVEAVVDRDGREPVAATERRVGAPSPSSRRTPKSAPELPTPTVPARTIRPSDCRARSTTANRTASAGRRPRRRRTPDRGSRRSEIGDHRIDTGAPAGFGPRRHHPAAVVDRDGHRGRQARLPDQPVAGESRIAVARSRGGDRRQG